jgi:hypothetical protein
MTWTVAGNRVSFLNDARGLRMQQKRGWRTRVIGGGGDVSFTRHARERSFQSAKAAAQQQHRATDRVDAVEREPRYEVPATYQSRGVKRVRMILGSSGADERVQHTSSLA